MWRVSLLDDAHARALRPILSSDECARADRFHAAADATRWTVAHGWLRHILSWYGGAPPGAITFGSGELGKPYVPNSDIEFSLSHSGGLALVAVARRGAVGVDVEQWDQRIDHLELAGQFFSPYECSSLASLEGHDAIVAGFFAAWTRKEAYMKATGHGIVRGLSHFDVSLAPREPVRLLDDRLDVGAVNRWTIAGLDVGAGYSGALAVTAPLRGIGLFDVPDVPVALR